MFEHIDPRSPTPLYAQIAARLKLAVAAGELRPGDTLPSVRQLAARLRVNPATVVQAYHDLEGEGFVEMKQGTGTFVREVAEGRRAVERAQQAGRLVRQMLEQAGQLGVTTNELTEAIRRELVMKVA